MTLCTNEILPNKIPQPAAMDYYDALEDYKPEWSDGCKLASCNI
jgi:hypothetical protein